MAVKTPTDPVTVERKTLETLKGLAIRLPRLRAELTADVEMALSDLATETALSDLRHDLDEAAAEKPKALRIVAGGGSQ